MSSTACESRRAMSERLSSHRAMRRKKTAQDAPGTIFSRGSLSGIPPLFEHGRPHRHVSCLTVIEPFRAGEDGVDAAVPVDAKNAPTATCKTAKNAVSHKRPHR